MALIFCDGFDHYGTGTAGRTNMLDGVYAAMGSTTFPQTSGGPRTGIASLRGSNTLSANYAVRTVGAPTTAMGAGVAYKYGGSGTTASGGLIQFRRNIGSDTTASGTEAQVTLGLVYDGPSDMFRLRVWRGRSDQGNILATSDPLVARFSYEHYEMFASIHPTAGAVEVRFNGITVIDISDVNTQQQADAEINYVAIANPGLSTSDNFDDFFCWNTSGSENNDFLGAQRVYTLFPDADTVAADWTSTEATGYQAIDEAAPDDDASYIEAANANDISEFSLANLPAEVASVAGVQMYHRLRKTEEGVSDAQVSMISAPVGSPPSPAVAQGTEHALPISYAYRADMFEIDPATGAPWTPSGFNAATLRIERTA